MSQNANLHHAINYIEFSAVDLLEAKRFYKAAFDWEFTDYGPEYAGIRNRNAPGECGGICRTEKVVTGGPLVILYSFDLESSLNSVQHAGGTITKEIFAFPGGRRFHFRDPSGNELAVWSTNRQPLNPITHKHVDLTFSKFKVTRSGRLIALIAG